MLAGHAALEADVEAQRKVVVADPKLCQESYFFCRCIASCTMV